MGMLYVDTPNRDSFACDIMEAVRPSVDAWLLDWIVREPFRRSDFFEERNGNCRLLRTLTAKLSETMAVWGKLVAPWAEYAARTLWATTSPSKSERRLSTPLTQQHRRIAKGRPSFAKVEALKPERLCRGFGKQFRVIQRIALSATLRLQPGVLWKPRGLDVLLDIPRKRLPRKQQHTASTRKRRPLGIPQSNHHGSPNNSFRRRFDRR